jgi:predicted phosphatase
MTNNVRYVSACLFYLALSLPLSAADPIQTTTTPIDPYSGMSAAAIAQMEAMIALVSTEHNVIFPGGDVNTDLYKQVQAKRTAENLEWLEKYRQFSGRDPNNEAAAIDLGGGFRVTASSVLSPRHFGDSRFLGGNEVLGILTSNQNILEDENRRLNKITNRIKQSKFACGHYDWIVQLKTKFNSDALKTYTDSLVDSAIAAAPMAFIANISPTLYEIIKWLRMNANLDLNTEKMKCEDLERAFTDAGRRMTRGDGYAACMQANTGLGISDAHRVCNSGQESPFDGIENLAGNIQGLNANAQNISITDYFADSMRPAVGTNTASKMAAATAHMNAVAANLAQANARLAANPDPGTQPNAPNGSAAMEAWTKAKRLHEEAKASVATYSTDMSEASAAVSAASTDVGIWGNLRSSLADNLGNIIGNIDLSLKANLQFGRQRQYQLILKYKHQAYLHSLELCTQLETHFSLISANTRDQNNISESYKYLQAYCFGSMQNPWRLMNPVYQIDSNHNSLTVRFGYDTLDKLSCLWTLYKNGSADSMARTVWADKFRTIEAINAISTYELYDFLLIHAERDKDTLLQEVVKTIKGPTDKPIYEHVKTCMDEYISLLTRLREEQIPLLAQTIHAVNQFKMDRTAPVIQGQGPALPVVPNDELAR